MASNYDPIRYNSGTANVLLMANRLTSGDTPKALTWHSYRVSHDIDDVFDVELDDASTRTAKQQRIGLSRAGLYKITASIVRDKAGATDIPICGLILSVTYPTTPPTTLEYSYQEGPLSDFTTLNLSNVLRVEPHLVGATISIPIQTQLGSGNTVVRGWNYTSGGFDPASDSSFVEVAYLGP